MSKKNMAAAIVAAVLIFTLAGCGSSEADGKTGKVIDKTGAVKATIVREFDESMYSVSELRTMMDEEIGDYNFSNAGDKVSAGDVSCTEGVLTCVIDYASAEDYAGFNSRRFVIESIDEAIATDLVKVSVKSVKDMTQADLSAIDETEYLYVLITDEPGYITFPGNVRYFSDGVESVTKKQVNVSEDMDGLAYIIYENK